MADPVACKGVGLKLREALSVPVRMDFQPIGSSQTAD